MNKQIKELEKQCWNTQTNHLDSELFAELIVKDCIEIVKPCKCGCTCEQEVIITDSIIADIKGHFGVE